MEKKEGKEKWSREDVLKVMQDRGRESFISEKYLSAFEASRGRVLEVGGESDLVTRASADYGENTVKMFGSIVDKKRAALYRWLYGEDVDVVVADEVVGEIQAIDGDVTVMVNCPGGDIGDGTVIRQALQKKINDGHQVTMFNVGFMGSMATAVGLDAQRWITADMASFYVHDSSRFMVTAGRFRAEDLDKLSRYYGRRRDALVQFNTELVEFYHKRSGLSKDELSEMMYEETEFIGQNAVDAGFFDEVYKVEKKEDESVSEGVTEGAVAEVGLEDFLAFEKGMLMSF